MKSLNIVLSFVTILLYTTTLFCQNTLPSTNWENPTILPTDTTDLWIADGDEANNIVAIFCQGGPSDELKYSRLPATSWRYLPNFQSYYRIHLHQSNTFNNRMFNTKESFTYERALVEVDNTSEMLHRTVSYFKSRGKVVYIFGHSYGAYIIPHYLATKTSRADKYIMCSGRLDDPSEAVQAHLQGMNGHYNHKKGGIFIPQKNKNLGNRTAQQINYYKAKQLIKAAAGALSFTKELQEIDLTNSIYVYTEKDERVGKLSDAELAFLKAKGVQIVNTKYNHGETIYGLVDAIEAGAVKL